MGEPQNTDLFKVNVGGTQGTADTGTHYSVTWAEMLSAISSNFNIPDLINTAGLTAALAPYALAASVYTQAQVDTALAGKAALAHTHVIADITDFVDNSANWNAAFGWGDHGAAGYAPGANVANWDAAFAWGNHADQSYLTAVPVGTDAALIAGGGVSNTEFDYLANVTSDIQSQIDSKAAAAHNHDAADINSGVLDIARIPAAVYQAPIVSSGAVVDLDAGQQANIIEGTHVVTTDGRAWVYSGSGDKTLEASYVEIADKTPEWSVIANKPTEFTPAAHTHIIGDVTGLQAALDGKQAAGSYAAAVHTHAIADVTGLQTALDGKAANTNVANWNAAFGWGDHAAAGYAAGSHTHTIANITGLQTALDSKLEDDGVAFTIGNYTFDIDQTVGASEDGYVLEYDHAAGQIMLKANAGGGGGTVAGNDETIDGDWDFIRNTAGLLRYTFQNSNTAAEQQTDIHISTVGTVAADLYLGVNYTNGLNTFLDSRPRAGGNHEFRFEGSVIGYYSASQWVMNQKVVFTGALAGIQHSHPTPGFDWQSYQEASGNLIWTIASTGGAEMRLFADGADHDGAATYLQVGDKTVLTRGLGQTIDANWEWNQGQTIQFDHAEAYDGNDGKIGAGVFGDGLAIVGVQGVASGGRVITTYGRIEMVGSPTWGGGLFVHGLTGVSAPTLGTAAGVLKLSNTDTGYGLDFGVHTNGTGWIQQHRFDGTGTAYNIHLQPAGGNVVWGTPGLHQLVSNGDIQAHDGRFTRGDDSGAVYFGDGSNYLYYVGSTNDWYLNSGDFHVQNGALSVSGSAVINSGLTLTSNQVSSSSHAYLTGALEAFIRSDSGSGGVFRVRRNGTVSEFFHYGATAGDDVAIYFGDSVDTVRGGFYYDTSANALYFRRYNNSNAGYLNASGWTFTTDVLVLDSNLHVDTNTGVYKFSVGRAGDANQGIEVYADDGRTYFDVRQDEGFSGLRINLIHSSLGTPNTGYIEFQNNSGEIRAVWGSSTQPVEHLFYVNSSSPVLFYSGSTQIGDLSASDATWFRINQNTSKNIYTPRYIRADGGFFIDGATYGLTGSAYLRVVNGSAGSPSMSFGLQNNLGFSNRGSNAIRFSAAGVERGYWNTTALYVNDLRQTSDRSLKKNIKPIRYGLAEVLKLRPFNYDWKEDGRHDIGFVAQDVEKIIPEVVDKDKKTRKRSMSYPKLTAVNTRAIQQMHDIIQKLEARVAELEAA